MNVMKQKGQLAEQFARSIYERARFEILEQNHRCGAYEVDLVARRDHIVHFVEVKYRKTIAEANLSLKPAQFLRIAHAAERFMIGRFELMQIDAFLLDHKLQWERIANIMIEID